MTPEELKTVLTDHAAWLCDEGGGRANLYGVNLSGADMSWANLRGADMSWANLREANMNGADMSGANLREANMNGANLREAILRGADMSEANMSWANLSGANLSGANLSGADLLCQGNMKELRTMQFDTWAIGYTADTLQIGCQRHPIDKWSRWDTDAGRKWIASMHYSALVWAERNMALVLQIIAANPATPTGHEGKS